MTRPAWRDAAACVKVGPEIFFDPTPAAVRRSKQICARCGARGECLIEALRRDERYGVWGGLTELERYLLDCPSTVPERGPARFAEDSALVGAFSDAGAQDRAVDVIRSAFDVAASTAYKYMARAQALGLVERRPDGWYPVAR